MKHETAETPGPASPAPWGLCDCDRPLAEKDHLSTPAGHDVHCEQGRHEIWSERPRGFWDD